MNVTKYKPRFMQFLKVLRAFTKWGLIQNLVNDWVALYSRGLVYGTLQYSNFSASFLFENFDTTEFDTPGGGPYGI